MADLRELILMALEDDADFVAVVLDLMADLDLEDRGERRTQIMRIDINFWRLLSGITFRQHFRMSKDVFEKLIVAVGRHLALHHRVHFIRTPLDAALMMAVWILATPEEISGDYIKWPGPLERHQIRHAFEHRYGYCGVIGCIDCCHIRILAPKIQPQRFVNRHHDYSIMIQAVCDHNLLYRDAYVGEAGSVGDVRTLYRSPLGDKIFRREGYISEGEHLLGDGIYALTEKIMIPYENDGHLTNRQKAHNYTLSSARSSIERSFALLRGKFRRLKSLPSYRLEYSVDHIVASMVLHNFILLEGETACLLGDNVDEYGHQAGDIRDLIAASLQDGILKREAIAEMIHPED